MSLPEETVDSYRFMAENIDSITEWITLRVASKLLGVHPATVRQWSDEGELDAFRTPGGHRRFARGDIERLMNVSPVRGSGLQSYLYTETVERTRKGLPEVLGRAGWAQQLPDRRARALADRRTAAGGAGRAARHPRRAVAEPTGGCARFWA